MKTHPTRETRGLRSAAALSATAAGLVVLAACGSSGGTSGSTSGGSTATSDQATSGTTVTVRTADGMRVLATSSGRTLYSSDQEHGKALCTSAACHAIWKPLTLPAGQTPSAPGAVAHDLSALTLSDGTRQVALDGRPLYTFSLDHGAGQVNGDGQADSFDGTDFSWHAAEPSGATAPAGSSSGSSGSSGSSSGSSGYGSGYGY